MTMLSNDPALYLAVAFIGSVAFLAFLGSIILFLGEVTKCNKTFALLDDISLYITNSVKIPATASA